MKQAVQLGNYAKHNQQTNFTRRHVAFQVKEIIRNGLKTDTLFTQL